MRKHKYYFSKPRSEIVKDILTLFLLSGVICVAATSPYFGINLVRGLKKWQRLKEKYPQRKIASAFYRLKKRGCLNFEYKNRQLYLSLTDEGKKKAGWLQIDNLKIPQPRKWDGKWRMVIFDISQLKKVHREAFRGKLKELGFYPLQKSVWAHPFDCRAETDLLKDFFDLNEKEVRLLIVENIGKDQELKRFFKLTN